MCTRVINRLHHYVTVFIFRGDFGVPITLIRAGTEGGTKRQSDPCRQLTAVPDQTPTSNRGIGKGLGNETYRKD